MIHSGKTKRAFLYICAFLLPVAVMLLVYRSLGVSPFGPKTLLTIDMSNEYVDYFSAFKSMFGGGASMLYSFGKILGGNMIGLFAYYLASPLNLIFLFFDRANFDIAVLVLTLLKLGLCGATFAYYLEKTYHKSNLSICVFALFYALMAYNIAYQLNIMWLDGVILLPLVTHGVDRIIDSRRPVFYYVALTFAILTNYYIGYMISIFSLLYFLYKVLISEGMASAVMKARFVGGRFRHFLISSVLAAATSGILLIPAVLSLSTGKQTFSLLELLPYPDYPFWDILSKILPGAFSYHDEVAGLPNIYCGLLVVLLVGLYFCNRRIAFREKICSLLFVLFLLLCFYMNTLNKIWHGFNPPAWFPFRYSFVLSFLLIVLAYQAFLHLDGVSARHVVLILILLTVLFIAVSHAGFPDLTRHRIAVATVFAAGYCLLTVLALHTKNSTGILAALLLPVVCCELYFNATSMLGNLRYTSKSYYSSYVTKTQAAVDSVKKADPGFYRMEKTFTQQNSRGAPSFNDALMFGYNGLSHYSSTDDKKINVLMQALGFKNNYNWAYYDRGSTPAANALLGVKYILTQGGNLGDVYTRVGRTDGITIYRNPFALPVAYMANKKAANVTPYISNPFALQNQLFNGMLAGRNAACLYPVSDVDISFSNISSLPVRGGMEYMRAFKDQPAYIEFDIRPEKDGPAYAYFPSDMPRPVSLSLNGKPLGSYMNVYHYGVIPLGTLKKGTDTVLRLTLSGDRIYLSGSEFYLLDLGRLAENCAALRRGGLNVTSYSSTYLKGDVSSNGQMLFTTIPYDTGWRVWIDGSPVSDYQVFGSLIGFDVPKGKHVIEMRYRPPGFVGGCVATALGLLCTLLYVYGLRSRGRR